VSRIHQRATVAAQYAPAGLGHHSHEMKWRPWWSWLFVLALGSGLEWAVARLFPFNKKDEASPLLTITRGLFLSISRHGAACRWYFQARFRDALLPPLSAHRNTR